MATIVGRITPLLLSSVPHQHRKSLIGVSHQRFQFASHTRIRIVVSSCTLNSRRIVVSAPKSASINGVSIENNLDGNHGEEEVELLEKVRRWIGFLPSILSFLYGYSGL